MWCERAAKRLRVPDVKLVVDGSAADSHCTEEPPPLAVPEQRRVVSADAVEQNSVRDPPIRKPLAPEELDAAALCLLGEHVPRAVFLEDDRVRQVVLCGQRASRFAGRQVDNRDRGAAEAQVEVLDEEK